MSIQAPQGILNIPNATLRVGKLAVDEVVGADTILNTVARNTILLVDDEAYHENKNWSLKLPNAWAGEFECNTASAGNYSEFNFYNEGASSNAQGYNLTFNDTAVELRYDGTLLKTGTLASTITGTGVKKVRLMFERTILSVTVDGTLVFTHDDTIGPRPRVYSTTAGGFLNFFTDGGALKNLKIVNEKWMSDGTSNIAYVGGGEVAVGQALAFNRVSNVSQIKVDSNVVTEYTGPHDRPLVKYPEVALTANSDKGYVASASSFTTREPWQAFDNNNTTSWTSGFDYSGTPLTGDQYLQLTLPFAIKVVKMYIKAYGSTNFQHAPQDTELLGSNDGETWNILNTSTDLPLEAYGASTFVFVNAVQYYKYLRLRITKIYTGSTSYARVAELAFYGYEEGSGSLDTTLKSVYNVPATTGTQLEVYYDAKDLADGAVSSDVTDLSPNTNNGTVSGDPQISNGAFVFDGTGDYFSSTVTTTTGAGNWPHSYSFWMKADTDAASTAHLVALGTEGVSTSAIRFNNDDIRWYFWGNDVIFKASNLRGRWVHIVGTYDGGAVDTSRKIFINNVEAPISSISGTIGSLNLTTTSTPFKVGSQLSNINTFKGSIANFRLYSKVLNADQVKELYDYQKDYFLGSKSQVTLYKGHLGVGVTEPSGQLQLAGDERLQEYPPGPMDDYETLIPGHGVFCASVSSNNTDTYAGWKAFNKVSANGEGWMSANLTYDDNTGVTNSATARFGGKVGEWLNIDLPYKIHLKQTTIIQRESSTNPRPASSFTIWGSNDKVNWDEIISGTSTLAVVNDSNGNPIKRVINTSKLYSSYRYQVHGVIPTSGSDAACHVAEWRLFGTPGPTTLDKGSLSLTRSLDVPRVSRYDVDTETPRPEKLVLDFDTTVNSSPTDISGKGNHGTFNGTNMNYSSADKAFVFNGTDDYIQGSCPASLSGNVSYTIALWVKFDTITTNNYDGIVEIGDRATNTTGGTFPSIFVYHGANLGFYFSNGGEIVNSGVLPVAGRWYHLVAVYDQGGNKGHFYIDGGTTFTGSGTPANTTNFLSTASVFLGGDSTASSGQYLDGKISNFKLYNVALEASEVKKLYNLGRTGRSMVISDTAVGIGKVPEAQLDVRGSIRCDGVVKPYTCAFSAYVSSGGNSSTTGVFPADGVHFNIGNCYDASTYEFTAPVYGIYHMSWSAYTNEAATTTSRIFAFQSNNLIEQKGNTIEKHGNSLSLTVRMQAGETFNFRGSGSYPIYYFAADGHNRFSGHLICAL